MSQQMELITKVGEVWCNFMHAAPTWPIHGHYHCGVCGREYPVPWEEPGAEQRG
jgi:hypothetical protein